MQYRRLGETGFKVSILGLGGEAAVEKRENPEKAEEIVNRALDLGINYIDTSPVYGEGGSEENLGRVMARRRSEAFLASKTHERSYDGTMRLIEESLNRLQTDYLDLYQLHNIRRNIELNEILGPRGALMALQKLREEGVIKNLGVTGHKDPVVLRRAIDNFEFDCVLMALNAADPHRASFKDGVLEQAREKNMGIIGMKVLAVGRILGQGGLKTPEEALGYVLSLPVSTIIVGTSSLEELEANAAFCSEFQGFDGEKMKTLEEKTALKEREGNFFKLEW